MGKSQSSLRHNLRKAFAALNLAEKKISVSFRTEQDIIGNFLGVQLIVKYTQNLSRYSYYIPSPKVIGESFLQVVMEADQEISNGLEVIKQLNSILFSAG